MADQPALGKRAPEPGPAAPRRFHAWRAGLPADTALRRDIPKLLGSNAGSGRVVEWGCGGGANAVHFAPPAQELIGVDISQESLEECGRQVESVCSTPVRKVLVDVENPEAALEIIPGECDLFLSFYVFELLPTPEYGGRIQRIAHRLLAPGGLALIQIKYDCGSWRTRSRGRSYRSGPAGMTTYTIPAFWGLAERCGWTPKYVQLVPKDELDERYAYFLLVNTGGDDA